MCSDFLYNFIFSEAFLILRRDKQDTIKNVIGLHVDYPLF